MKTRLKRELLHWNAPVEGCTITTIVVVVVIVHPTLPMGASGRLGPRTLLAPLVCTSRRMYHNHESRRSGHSASHNTDGSLSRLFDPQNE